MVAEEDGSPLAGAVVTAISLAGNVGFGVTDAKGMYWIASLPASDYIVLAAAPGRIGTFYDQVLSWEDATPVRVDDAVLGVDFILAPIDSRGPGSISGRIVDWNGDGVVQACIYAEPEAGEETAGFAMSGAGGRYVLSGTRSRPL